MRHYFINENKDDLRFGARQNLILHWKCCYIKFRM